MEVNSSESSGQGKNICRIVVQQCENANLSFDTSDPQVSINRGMIVFTCFLRGATEQALDQIVGQILNAKLCETETGGREAARLTQNRFDVLVIPQATLGGKSKGKNLQYHSIIDKTVGAELFKKFVEKIKAEMNEKGDVRAGIYGARQILNTETNGPFTHIFDF